MYNPETAELSQRIGGEGGGGGGTELASPAYTPPSFTSLPQDDPGSLSPSALALREPLVIVLIVVSGITLLMGGLVMASCFWETYKTERRLREQEVSVQKARELSEIRFEGMGGESHNANAPFEYMGGTEASCRNSDAPLRSDISNTSGHCESNSKHANAREMV